MSTVLPIIRWMVASAVLGGAQQGPTSLVERVDLIELNHFLDENGREVFQQLVFYDWSKPERRFHVRAWRLVKAPEQLPRRRWNPAAYECVWHDGGVRKMVTAPAMRETWSQEDPERANRKFLSEDRRIPLWRFHADPASEVAARR